MAAANHGPDYLVLITLIGTSDPVVTRTLSVPISSTFEALHQCIAAAFGWKVPGVFEEQTWTFFVLKEDPLPTELPSIDRPLLRLYDGACVDDRDDFRYTMVNVYGIFHDLRYRGKAMVYSTTGANDLHLLKVIGRSSDPCTHQITCVGGQGRIPFVPWCTEIVDEERRNDWNSWDPGFDRIKARLERFQGTCEWMEWPLREL